MGTTVSTETTDLQETNWMVYPNPLRSDGSFSLSAEGATGPVSIGIYNLQGKMIHQWNFESFNDTQNLQLGISSPGAYFLRIATPTADITKKIILSE
jgi:hypothetical protein